jgi:hypothetical protein
MADLGSDFSGILDIDPALTVVTGERCLAEAEARRLTTPAGSMLGDPDYGYDLRQHVNAAIVNTNAIATNAENECLKDERADGVTTDLSYIAATQALTLDMELSAADAEFKFTLEITDVTAELLWPDNT